MTSYKKELDESLKYANFKEIEKLLPLVEVNKLDDCGMAYLHYSYTDFGEDVFKTLLKSPNININVPDDKGNTPLILAVDKSIEEVRILLDAGADINAQNTSKQTALIKAVSNKSFSVDIIKLLIEKGADCDAIDRNGYSALGQTLFITLHPAFDILLEHTDVTLNKKGINIMLINILTQDFEGLAENKIIEKICLKAYADDKIDALETQLNKQMQYTICSTKQLYFKDTINSIRLNNKLEDLYNEKDEQVIPRKGLKL